MQKPHGWYQYGTEMLTTKESGGEQKSTKTREIEKKKEKVKNVGD